MWKLLADLGHTVVKAVPSLFTFRSKDALCAGLAGLSVPNVRLAVSRDASAGELSRVTPVWAGERFIHFVPASGSMGSGVRNLRVGCTPRHVHPHTHQLLCWNRL